MIELQLIYQGIKSLESFTLKPLVLRVMARVGILGERNK